MSISRWLVELTDATLHALALLGLLASPLLFVLLSTPATPATTAHQAANAGVSEPAAMAAICLCDASDLEANPVHAAAGLGPVTR
jgi:hypothetical protein